MKHRSIPLLLLSVLGLQLLAQNQAEDLITVGQRQLQNARASRTDQAYQEAEDIFAKAVAQNPTNAKALFQRGAVKLERSGVLAQQGKFGPASELMQAGTADIDRAVSLAPDQLDLRLMRGVSYGYFPPFLNKTAIAREDLEIAVRHHQFHSLANEKRVQAHLALGIVYANSNDIGKAAQSFLAAIDADPDSRAAKDARERMKKLANSEVKVGMQYRPDRFPLVAGDTSPIIAAASITFPNGQLGKPPASMEHIMKQLDGYHGLLGKHMVASINHPGMFIIFTWWQNKKALNDWFYGDLHQGWMRERGEAMSDRSKAAGELPSQVAMEVFAGLPGGVQINGGFIPRDVLNRMEPR